MGDGYRARYFVLRFPIQGDTLRDTFRINYFNSKKRKETPSGSITFNVTDLKMLQTKNEIEFNGKKDFVGERRWYLKFKTEEMAKKWANKITTCFSGMPE